VWLVSGLDESLAKVKWKRFATGLFQPLGCKVVDGKIYVLGRDQITRLHDLNGDGEADFYENFNNDSVVTDNYHEFALDLQTDRAGNFYYAKGVPWEPTATSPHQGVMIRVSKDGSKFEIVASGLRAPNGLGMGPEDQLSVSDNEGTGFPQIR
jgi:glucose/arabinose dehydrogenase